MTLKKLAVALALLATATSAAFAQARDHRTYYNYAPSNGYSSPTYSNPGYGSGGVGGGESGDMGIGSQR